MIKCRVIKDIEISGHKLSINDIVYMYEGLDTFIVNKDNNYLGDISSEVLASYFKEIAEPEISSEQLYKCIRDFNNVCVVSEVYNIREVNYIDEFVRIYNSFNHRLIEISFSELRDHFVFIGISNKVIKITQADDPDRLCICKCRDKKMYEIHLGSYSNEIVTNICKDCLIKLNQEIAKALIDRPTGIIESKHRIDIAGEKKDRGLS